MDFEWDEEKREANVAKHGIDFVAVEKFDFETALIAADDRYVYGEKREIALGFIGSRLHVRIFHRRAGKVRVISLRKANEREIQAI